jgi:hypothetical protein
MVSKQIKMIEVFYYICYDPLCTSCLLENDQNMEQQIADKLGYLSRFHKEIKPTDITIRKTKEILIWD